MREEFQLCPCHTAEERWNPTESGPKKEILGEIVSVPEGTPAVGNECIQWSAGTQTKSCSADRSSFPVPVERVSQR
jgi:hypothetical protein